MTHRLTWWQTWLTSLGMRKPTEGIVPLRVEEIPPQRLRKILVVVAKLRGATCSDQLLVNRMSPDCMLFITRADLCEGDRLQIQILVPTFGTVNLVGDVAWLRPSSKGCLEGELRLDLAPHQRQILSDYLERDARGHR